MESLRFYKSQIPTTLMARILLVLMSYLLNWNLALILIPLIISVVLLLLRTLTSLFSLVTYYFSFFFSVYNGLIIIIMMNWLLSIYFTCYIIKIVDYKLANLIVFYYIILGKRFNVLLGKRLKGSKYGIIIKVKLL